MFDLTTRDIKFISGVGPQKAAVLNKELEIYSLYDLIYYFPYKYVDRSRIYYIHEIDGNMPYIQLKGEILGFETIGEGRQRRLTAHFSDGTGVVDLVWFQGIKYILGKYKLHEEYIIFGKPTVFNGRINVAHPDVDKPEDLKLSSVGLQPYYNTTEKMKRSFLNSHAIEKMMATVIQQIQEPLPETLSPMWKVSVRILGIRLSYICQKAQMDRNAKPTSTVRLVLSFIEEPPFPCRYNRIISVLLGEVQTFLSKESKKRVK